LLWTRRGGKAHGCRSTLGRRRLLPDWRREAGGPPHHRAWTMGSLRTAFPSDLRALPELSRWQPADSKASGVLRIDQRADFTGMRGHCGWYARPILPLESAGWTTGIDGMDGPFTGFTAQSGTRRRSSRGSSIREQADNDRIGIGQVLHPGRWRRLETQASCCGSGCGFYPLAPGAASLPASRQRSQPQSQLPAE